MPDQTPHDIPLAMAVLVFNLNAGEFPARARAGIVTGSSDVPDCASVSVLADPQADTHGGGWVNEPLKTLRNVRVYAELPERVDPNCSVFAVMAISCHARTWRPAPLVPAKPEPTREDLEAKAAERNEENARIAAEASSAIPEPQPKEAHRARGAAATKRSA